MLKVFIFIKLQIFNINLLIIVFIKWLSKDLQMHKFRLANVNSIK